ncbi:LLM class flavin-dependent oxidoreductase [Paractinoplanes maris]|uniref:LLM class flavin-dependent oxidoreductase n=1 Tax=Paractinoplanes maris TaxID=1734446 RepID=UPI0020204F2A|nr:LLM class flavin-dependent oxidoreductase [Actinoplanes maris]
MSSTYLWYIPNTVEPGHRGDDAVAGYGTLEHSVDLARTAEQHGWQGALIGTGWGRPDTFTVATAIAARTTTFRPLAAIRPGYWQPAHFASSAATLDHLSGGRLLVNIVSGQDNLAAYGDAEGDQPQRYARTKEFMRIVRRLWTEEDVTVRGSHFEVRGSTLPLRPATPPRLYFGGASAAAERVSATEADVQLFWGEPLDGIAARVDRLRRLSSDLDRDLAPLEFGLRITTLIRDTREQAWHDAEARVAAMARRSPAPQEQLRGPAVGQQRLLDLAGRGDVLDTCLYTAPGRYGGGGAGTTWLAGSAGDVAAALDAYAALGISHFVLSDTPYRTETARVGDALLATKAPGPGVLSSRSPG